MRIRSWALVLAAALLAAAAGGCAAKIPAVKPALLPADSGIWEGRPDLDTGGSMGSGVAGSGSPWGHLGSVGGGAGSGTALGRGGELGDVAGSGSGSVVGRVAPGSPAPKLKAKPKAPGAARGAGGGLAELTGIDLVLPGQDETPEARARKDLERLGDALKPGNLYWQDRQQMKQGKESPVKAEINLSAEPYFLQGREAPTGRARIQTSATMSAELIGNKDDFEISPSGGQSQPLLDGRALWVWTVKPLTFGHGKRLRLLIRMQPKMSDTDLASYTLPPQEADIDVAVSPTYLISTHKTWIFGTGGTGGLLGLLKNKKLRDVVRRLLPGSPAPGPPSAA